MKKLLLLLPFLIISCEKNEVEECIELPVKTIEVFAQIDSQAVLIQALIQVESRGLDSAIGDKHLVGNEAIGALQIRPIMVREVNRILNLQNMGYEFKLRDRFDREKSIEMFLIWKNYHHANDKMEVIARNWNGGPRGYKKDRTIKYWSKVQQELDI